MPRNRDRITGFGSGGFAGGDGGSASSAAATSLGTGNLAPIIISPFNEAFSIGKGSFHNQNAVPTLASTTWPSANRAFGVPFWIPTSMIVTTAWWQNGAGAAAGNIEVGVYTSAFAKVITTGAIAQVGSSVVQTTALSTTLTAGQYYLWISASDGTATLIADTISSAIHTAAIGIFTQNAVGPGSAPDPAVPATPASAFNWLFGLSTRSF